MNRARYHGSPPLFGFSGEIPETLMALRRGRCFVDTCSRDGVEKGISWAAEVHLVLLVISGGGTGSSVCAWEELLRPGGEVVVTKCSGRELPGPEEGCSSGGSATPPLLLRLLGADRARSRGGGFDGESPPSLLLLLLPDIYFPSPAAPQKVCLMRLAEPQDGRACTYGDWTVPGAVRLSVRHCRRGELL